MGFLASVRDRNKITTNLLSLRKKVKIDDVFSLQKQAVIFETISNHFKYKQAEPLSFKKIKSLYRNNTREKIEKNSLEDYLISLEREKKIFDLGKGAYKVYDQTEKITSIDGILTNRLSNVSDLHALVKLFAEHFEQLFEYMDLYLACEDENGKTFFMIVQRSGGRIDISNYATPKEAEKTLEGTLAIFKKESKPIRLIKLGNTDPYLDQKSHEHDREIFQYPDADILQGLIKTDDGKILGAWTVRENNEKGDGRKLKPLYSPNNPADSVNTALQALSDQVALQIQRICGQRDPIAVWKEEIENIRSGFFRESEVVLEAANLEDEISFWTAYSKYMHVFIKSRDHRTVGKEIANLLRIDPENTVMDAGCGLGNWFKECLPSWEGKNLKLKGFDITPAMIEKAKKNFPLEQNIEFTVVDWCKTLPYQDSSIDKIASVWVFGYVSDPDKALAETLRILKQGGVFSLTVPIPKYNSYMLFLRGVWHDILDQGVMNTAKDIPYGWQCIKFMREIHRKIQMGIYRGYLPEDLEKALTKAGFCDVYTAYSSGSQYFTVGMGRKSNV